MNKHVLLITLCFLLGACKSNETSYFPLNSGYSWHYDVRQITRDGLDRQKYILNNLGEGELDGQRVFLKRSIDGTTLYYSMTEDAIVYLGNTNNKTLSPEFKQENQTVIRKPFSVDTEWQQLTTTKLLKKTGPPQKTEFKIIAEVPLEEKIASIDETINVPAGRFENCMKVTMTGSTYKNAGNYVGLTVVKVKQTNWYAKGVGLVKMERIETTQSEALDKGSLLVELVDFDTG